MHNLSYNERLRLLNFNTLEERRIKFDIIFLFKIINNLVDISFSELFTFNNRQTRGHNQKINCQFSRTNCRKYFFANRVVNIWNGLPENVVNKDTLQSFKKHLNEIDFSNYCRGRAYRAQ